MIAAIKQKHCNIMAYNYDLKYSQETEKWLLRSISWADINFHIINLIL